MPKGFEAGHLYSRPKQLLEVLHIVDGLKAGGQAAHGLWLKVQFQHFLNVFTNALLNALLDALFREILLFLQLFSR